MQRVTTHWVAALLLIAGCSGNAGDSERQSPIPVSPVVSPRPHAGGHGGATVQYSLRFPEPHTHYVEVEAVFPAAGLEVLPLRMAVWTPGSYLVREYSRHIDAVTASTLDGQSLAVDKVRKNRWAISTGGAEQVVVRYRLYARTLSVRGNFVDPELAVLNGAATYLDLVADGERSFDISLEPAPGWPVISTSLPPHPDGTAHRFLAASFDELVDSPIVLGSAALHEFEVRGVPHVLANFGAADLWDSARSARDVEAIVKAQFALWQVSPYERYLFLNVLARDGGGLEHRASTLLLADPWSMRRPEQYRRWLSLVSHELFHAWNVKRLRPVELGPFDYEAEVYTRSLWVVEGLTSYYDDLLLARAGLLDRSQYLKRLSKSINRLQTTPGRLVQPLAAASYDAWIKYYRPDENADNTTISYYTKGAVVGFVLDAEIRRATAGRRSLDDVMRLAYQRYAGDQGYTPAQFRAVVAEVAGEPMEEFFERYIDGMEELDYSAALDWYGLEFRPAKPDPDQEEIPGWLGVELDPAGRITKVPRGTPGHQAGLNVDDEILAAGDYRVPPGQLDTRLEAYRPGDSLSLLVARRGKLQRLEVVLGEEPVKTWDLRPAPTAGLGQRGRLAELLRGD